MKIVFVSNYFNHHQKPFSDAISSLKDIEYYFIETQPIEEERLLQGWKIYNGIEYLLRYYEEPKKCMSLIDTADIVMVGSSPAKLMNRRLHESKVIFRYAERQIRSKPSIFQYIWWYIKWHKYYPAKKPVYLLCASAFSAADYSRLGVFREKAYKWGYFPHTSFTDIDSLLKKKQENKIIWVGRLLKLKHPDDVLLVAGRLREEGYQFTIDFLGGGEMEKELRTMAYSMGLNEQVRFLGFHPQEEVHSYMEKAGIFLLTSDFREGWGAVLNEAMNTGCAAIASHAAGSTAFLVRNGENGFVYRSGDTDELYSRIRYLLDYPDEQRRLGKAAYHTITQEWNEAVAAERFVDFSEHILAGEDPRNLFESGPCSKAEMIRNDWFG